MERLTVTTELKTINNVLIELMTNKGVSFQIFDVSTKHHKNIIIEPSYYKGDLLDGMVINYEDGIYEVSQLQAGKKQNELHVYLETKSFKIALKNMLKGNLNRKSIKIWD